MAAFFALLPGSRRAALFFVLALATALQVIYGFGPAYWISSHAPGLRAFNNWRVICIADFCIAILAGLGISSVQRRLGTDHEVRARWFCLCAGTVVFLAGLAALSFRESSRVSVLAELVRGRFSVAFFAVASFAILSPLLARRLRPRVFGLCVLSILACDLVTYGYRHVPFVSPKSIFPRSGVFEFLLREAAGKSRVLSLDMTLPSNAELSYGAYSATGYDFPLNRSVRILAPIVRGTEALTAEAAKVLQNGRRLIDLFNIRYLIISTYSADWPQFAAHESQYRIVFSDGPVRVIENRNALARAFIVPARGAKIVSGDDEALAEVLSSDFDPDKQVILNEAPAWLNGHGGESDGGHGFVLQSFQQKDNEILVSTDVAGPCILLVSDTYYPGWQVFVDNQRTKLLVGDYAFKAVALEKGSHVIRFLFTPTSFSLGAWLSGLALMLGALCFMIEGRIFRRRQS
jgi:hypothetical protein